MRGSETSRHFEPGLHPERCLARLLDRRCAHGLARRIFSRRPCGESTAVPGERIDLEIRFEEELFEIRLIDYGEFVDPAQMKGRDLDDVKPGGLGLHFIHSVMDSVEYRKNKWGGTTLILQKQVDVQAPAQDEFGFDDLDVRPRRGREDDIRGRELL